MTSSKTEINSNVHTRSRWPLLKLAAAASSAVALLAGCHLFGPDRTVENYFPLAVGNQWSMSRASQPSDSMTLEVSDKRAIGGMTFYKLTTPGEPDYANWLTHRNGELRIYFTQSDSAPDTASTSYTRWLKEPFDVGKSWTVQPDDSSETLRITANDVTLTVPAGTFEHCVQVEVTDMATYSYAPGVGWVEISEAADTADPYVLTRYVIK
ncbi:MAG TPA: hypothetical protein VMH22_07155 [bacterium]|nr:hypothetical protein [bacterium]